MALQLSQPSPLPHESPSSVSHTTAQKMIALTTTATPSVMHNTTITKRPKLSLQTASVPATFGNSNTGLARTCVTASPTVRNTFNNAYEIKNALSAIDSPSPCRSAGGPRHGSPFLSNSFRSDAMPYQLPLGVRGILRNSPLKRITLARRSVSISAGAIAENRRVYFPAKKQVSFRSNPDEEIKTVRFVVRHSDIETDSENEPESDSEGDSGSDSASSQSDHSSSGEDDGESRDEPVRRKKRKSSVSSERQIRAAALRDGFDDDRIAVALTAGPSARNRKRRCKWRWTLDNLSSSSSAGAQLETIPSAEPPSSAQSIQETQPIQVSQSSASPAKEVQDVS